MTPGSAGVSPAPAHAPRWRSRGYLPQFDCAGLVQTISFRRADSLPATAIAALTENLAASQGAERRKRLEAYLDAGRGACHLRDPRIARLVEDAPLYGDGERYRLLAWVVMPNHVHLLIETLPTNSLSEIVQAWNSSTATLANPVLGRTGRFWQPEYFDRVIRDERHLANAVAYIHGTFGQGRPGTVCGRLAAQQRGAERRDGRDARAPGKGPRPSSFSGRSRPATTTTREAL